MKHFLIEEDRAVAGIVIEPENNGVRIFVAWDWEGQVKEKNIISFYKSRDIFPFPTTKNIIETCKTGKELTQKEALKYFKGIIPAKLIKSNNMVGEW